MKENIINRLFFKLGWVKVRKGKNIKLRLKKESLVVKGKVFLEDGVILSSDEKGTIELGENVKICENSKLLACDGKIIIGERTQLGDYNYITGQGEVIIGRDVLFASNINIISKGNRYEDISKPVGIQGATPEKITIEDGTFIGINTTILAGSHIGRNCVVGANSLVKGTFPDYCVLVGNPARIIKQYDLKTKSWKSVKTDKHIDEVE